MDYTALTDEHKRQMWRQMIAQLEERHYALTMDRIMAAAITGNGEAVAARLAELDAQIVTIEEQHAAALAHGTTAPATGEV
jgi:uncharacterized membrane protein